VRQVWYDEGGDLGMYWGELGKRTGAGVSMLFDIGVLGVLSFEDEMCCVEIENEFTRQ